MRNVFERGYFSAIEIESRRNDLMISTTSHDFICRYFMMCFFSLALALFSFFLPFFNSSRSVARAFQDKFPTSERNDKVSAVRPSCWIPSKQGQTIGCYKRKLHRKCCGQLDTANLIYCVSFGEPMKNGLHTLTTR